MIELQKGCQDGFKMTVPHFMHPCGYVGILINWRANWVFFATCVLLPMCFKCSGATKKKKKKNDIDTDTDTDTNTNTDTDTNTNTDTDTDTDTNTNTNTKQILMIIIIRIRILTLC